MTKNNLQFLICAALTLFPACSSQLKPDGLPKLYPLTLTLTQDGVPLDGASVSLFADDGVSTWTIGGTTDASGNMSPKTHGKFPGIPAGTYKVCVVKIETVPSARPEQDPDEYDVVDVKLRSPITTTLTLEAGPGIKNVTLDVGKPIRKLIIPD
jgi:hypothetical protein